MNVLLMYPEFPDTFWSFKHALAFIRQKASFPPLGLLTVAALLPLQEDPGADLRARHYYARIKTFLREYRPPRVKAPLRLQHVLAFLRSVGRLGIVGKERVEYWKLLTWTLRRPGQLPLAVRLAIYGHHHRRICELHVLRGKREVAS